MRYEKVIFLYDGLRCHDDRDVFRLYYTSECEDQQTIDVYFEDNHNQVYQLTFTFNNEAKEEEDTTEGNTITPIGTIVSPINIVLMFLSLGMINYLF